MAGGFVCIKRLKNGLQLSGINMAEVKLFRHRAVSHYSSDAGVENPPLFLSGCQTRSEQESRND